MIDCNSSVLNNDGDVFFLDAPITFDVDGSRCYEHYTSPNNGYAVYTLLKIIEANDEFFNNNLDEGLVGYWPFDAPESTSTLAVDVVSNHDAHVKNSAFGNFGIKGQAYKLNGTSNPKNYLEIGHKSSLNLRTFSLAAWINISSLPLGDYSIITKGDGDDLIRNYELRIVRGDNQGLMPGNYSIDCVYESNDDSDLFVRVYNPISWNLLLNKYRHIVCAMNRTSWEIYIDGNRITSGKSYYDTSDTISAPSSKVPASTDGLLYFGAKKDGSAFTKLFNGTLDEIGIWNRSLNSSEVKQLYNLYVVFPLVSGVGWSPNPPTVSKEVNLTASGTDLNGILLNYTVFNSTGIVFSVEHTASSSTSDYVSWTPLSVMNPVWFNVTVVSTGQRIMSLQSYVAYGSQEADCNLTKFNDALPKNSTWNSGLLGKFIQTQGISGGSWIPADKTGNYNETSGECNFKCNSGFTWNGSNCNPHLIINYCWQITSQDSCVNAPASIPNRSFGNCGAVFEENDCDYTVECECTWNGSSCNAANYTLESNCISPRGSCYLTYEVKDECDSGADNIIVREIAEWSIPGGIPPFGLVCESKEEFYPCAETTALRFFGWINFIVSLLTVAFIYYISSAFKRS